MKHILQSLFVFILMHWGAEVIAQKTTIILVRHAEKDTTAQGSTMMTADPPLTEQGKQRAIKLVKVLKSYKIDSIFSTNFIRTKSTVQPLAEKRNIIIKTYDHKKLDAFAAQLKAMKGKTVVVAGHSNSTPMLVNAILGEKRYENLDESVYNKIFYVTIKNDKIKVKVKTY